MKKFVVDARLKKAESLFNERKKLNEETDITDYLQLCDKADILRNAGDKLIHLGFKSKNEAKSQDVAGSLNNLAVLYYKQREYDKAEPLLQRALTIKEAALGPDDPSVATTIQNLGLFYKAQHQYTKAEPLYQRAFAIREKALGPDHPDVAMSLTNLAGLYDKQHQSAKAEPLIRRALEIVIGAFGRDQPAVAKAMENYAILLRNMSRPDEAAALESRAKAIRAQNPD